MKIRVALKDLRFGDVLAQPVYGGGQEVYPITIRFANPARAKGSIVLDAVDAKGRRVNVPVGHGSTIVEVERA